MKDSLPFSELVKAVAKKKVMSARVVRVYSKNLLVSIGGHLALLPKEEGRWLKSTRVGSYLEVMILSADEVSHKVFVTNKNIEKLRFDQRANSLEVGKVYRGTVRDIVDYGLFIDIFGVSGLLHIDELSWKRADRDPYKFHIGQKIDVSIQNVDLEQRRIRLSIKDILPDPFRLFFDKHSTSPAPKYVGTVRNVLDYGIFVEIGSSGLEGLIHASTFGGGNKLLDDRTKAIFRIGSRVPVSVLSIDTDKRRVALAYRGIPLEKIELQPNIGEKVQGTVIATYHDKVKILVGDERIGYVHVADGADDFDTLTFSDRPGFKHQFTILGLDFGDETLRLVYVPPEVEGEAEDARCGLVLENFLSGKSYLDAHLTLRVASPYLVLVRQLMYFHNLRKNKLFDYIYHFGIVVGVSELRLFGLAHRASIEFRLNRPELAVALIHSVLKDAITMRNRGLVNLATRVIRRNLHLILKGDGLDD